jgi:sulfonate transport system substrate-binding protein
VSDFSGLDAGVVSLFLQRRVVRPLSTATVADQQRGGCVFSSWA